MDFVRHLIATQEAEKMVILRRVLGLKPAAPKPAAPTLADRQLDEQRRQAQIIAAQAGRALKSLGVDHGKTD